MMRRRTAAAGSACGVADDDDYMDDYNYASQDGPLHDGDSEEEDMQPMSDDEDY